MLLNMSMIH